MALIQWLSAPYHWNADDRASANNASYSPCKIGEQLRLCSVSRLCGQTTQMP
ncbi:hypothetical protein [Pseudomonas fluorescens]|uniref:hypothetical protein n=1 Tax=Pseudomonas fluorescens TaxID=294 RepID=UPI00177BC948|nr:hypothetical protein [Pseudomonas fluorescens]